MKSPRELLRRVLGRIIKELPRSDQLQVLRRAAVELGIPMFACDGELGRFLGSPHDDWVHLIYLRDRTWSSAIQELLRQTFLGRGGTLIDVGANIGLTSIPVAKANGVRCYAFEPDPDNYQMLTANIALNDAAASVVPFNLALASEPGTFELERSEGNFGDHRLRLGSAPGVADIWNEARRQTVNVRVERLDVALSGQELGGPIAMKVDVQGAEVRVLQGGGAILDRVDVVIAEYCPYMLLRMGDSSAAFFEEMRRFPYAGVITETAAGAPAPVELMPVDDAIAAINKRVPVDGHGVDAADVVLARTPKLEAR